MRIIKAGILDDQNHAASIQYGAELYAPMRAKYMSPVQGANQMDAMPPA